MPLRSVPGTAAPLPPAPPAGSAGSAGSVPRHLVVLASASVQVCIPPPGHQISTFTTPSDVAQAATTDGSGPALRRGLTLGAVPWLPLITLVSLAPSESGLNGLMVLIVTTVDFPQTSCHPATSLPESGHSWGECLSLRPGEAMMESSQGRQGRARPASPPGSGRDTQGGHSRGGAAATLQAHCTEVLARGRPAPPSSPPAKSPATVGWG